MWEDEFNWREQTEHCITPVQIDNSQRTRGTARKTREDRQIERN